VLPSRFIFMQPWLQWRDPKTPRRYCSVSQTIVIRHKEIGGRLSTKHRKNNIVSIKRIFRQEHNCFPRVEIHSRNFADFILDLRSRYSQLCLYIGFTCLYRFRFRTIYPRFLCRRTLWFAEHYLLVV
jgi:hypothetical protein